MIVIEHEERFAMFAHRTRCNHVHHLVQCAVTARQADETIGYVPHPLLAFCHRSDHKERVAVVRLALRLNDTVGHYAYDPPCWLRFTWSDTVYRPAVGIAHARHQPARSTAIDEVMAVLRKPFAQRITQQETSILA